MIYFPPPPQASHRPLPNTVFERKGLASRIVNLRSPSEEQKATLEALGRDAMEALLKGAETVDIRRQDWLVPLILKSATPADTDSIFGLSSWMIRNSREPFLGGGNSALMRWLTERSDPDIYLKAIAPGLLSNKETELWLSLFPIIQRSNDPKIVDRLFLFLKDESTPPSLRRSIYGSIARTERPDILRWLAANRSHSRQRSLPNPSLSHGKDSDGDGLMDDDDINPFAAPRTLMLEEQVMKVAAESQLRFRLKTEELNVFFPEGTTPFELVGFDGTIHGAVRPPQPMPPPGWHGVPHNPRRMPSTIDFFVSGTLLPESTEATVSFGENLEGWMVVRTEVRLRKIAGEWYAVGTNPIGPGNWVPWRSNDLGNP